MELSYTVRRSKRKTVALQITPAAEIVIRAPLLMSEAEIAAVVERKRPWLEKHLQLQQRLRQSYPEPSRAEAEAFRARAQRVLPQRVAHYAERMQLYPSSLRIGSARRSFGSCNAANALTFSWRLMQYPDEAIDYVVVHELAHIAHKNHSPAFYACIAQVMPDYKQRQALFRQPIE